MMRSCLLIYDYFVFVFNRVLVETFVPVYTNLKWAYSKTLCLNISNSFLIYNCFGSLTSVSDDDIAIWLLIRVLIALREN